MAVEKTSPLDIPNSGVIKASGVRKNLTPVKVMLFRWYSLPSSTVMFTSATVPGLLGWIKGMCMPSPPVLRMVTIESVTCAVK